jgi:uncharacterized protein YbaP (TraB family)
LFAAGAGAIDVAAQEKPPAFTEASCAKPGVTAPRRGLFYEVKQGSNTLYLFGTVHVGKPEYFPLDRKVTEALCQAQFLALEADVSDLQAIGQMVAELGTYPPDDSLDRHLPSPLVKQLADIFIGAGITKAQLVRMRPVTVAATLDALGMLVSGYDPGMGIEYYFINLAKTGGIPVAEVESLRFQFDLLNSLPSEEQQLWLEHDIQSIASGEMKEQLDSLANKWEAGDASKLQAAMQQIRGEMPRATEIIFDKLLTARNPGMASRIEGFLKSGKRYFVAIGSLHLLGGDGVPERLRRDGYEVREIQ